MSKFGRLYILRWVVRVCVRIFCKGVIRLRTQIYSLSTYTAVCVDILYITCSYSVNILFNLCISNVSFEPF